MGEFDGDAGYFTYSVAAVSDPGLRSLYKPSLPPIIGKEERVRVRGGR
jgi:hypothetical protein